jgi:hypothetical protein
MAHLFKIEEPFTGYINLDMILYIRDHGAIVSIQFDNNTEIYVSKEVGKEILNKCYIVNENNLINE